MYLPPGGFMGYPWAYTRRPDETLPIIHDFGGGAPCGGYVYLDDGLPETYRGRIFHCEWGQGKVWAVKVAPDGAGFKYVDQIAFMDPADKVKDFRPFSHPADGRRPRLLRHRLGLQRLAAEQEGWAASTRSLTSRTT